jgi:hypothetical protein
MCNVNYIQLPSLGERLPQVPDDIAGLPLVFLNSSGFFPQMTTSKEKAECTDQELVAALTAVKARLRVKSIRKLNTVRVK